MVNHGPLRGKHSFLPRFSDKEGGNLASHHIIENFLAISGKTKIEKCMGWRFLHPRDYQFTETHTSTLTLLAVIYRAAFKS